MPIDENHPVHNLFYSVEDPQSPLDQSPAMTTLLYGVLGNNTTKFEEACRLIELFMVAAYEKGKEDTLQHFREAVAEVKARDATP